MKNQAKISLTTNEFGEQATVVITVHGLSDERSETATVIRKALKDAGCEPARFKHHNYAYDMVLTVSDDLPLNEAKNIALGILRDRGLVVGKG